MDDKPHLPNPNLQKNPTINAMEKDIETKKMEMESLDPKKPYFHIKQDLLKVEIENLEEKILREQKHVNIVKNQEKEGAAGATRKPQSMDAKPPLTKPTEKRSNRKSQVV
ncbi:hypothetical protein JTB14_000594 [Gonioctena quinquepunctata]|nr:hypothetical protein JTB14_000594 [Gonioctena quinquepunctata]